MEDKGILFNGSVPQRVDEVVPLNKRYPLLFYDGEIIAHLDAKMLDVSS